MQSNGAVRIPEAFDYASLPCLSTEEVEKLTLEKPPTLAAAQQIPGITPKALLYLYNELNAAQRKQAQRARRSTSTSRPKSAKRSTSRSRQRTEYGHGQSLNRHARPSQPSTPRAGGTRSTSRWWRLRRLRSFQALQPKAKPWPLTLPLARAGRQAGRLAGW
jgi:hypothetical protein